jgi:hypothetical protein
MSVTDRTNLVNKDASSERELLDRTIPEDGGNTVKKVDLEIEAEAERDEVSIPPLENEIGKRTDVLMPSLTRMHIIVYNLFGSLWDSYWTY